MSSLKGNAEALKVVLLESILLNPYKGVFTHCLPNGIEWRTQGQFLFQQLLEEGAIEECKPNRLLYLITPHGRFILKKARKKNLFSF